MIEIGDLKWIAGFLEGEGSFSGKVKNRNFPQPRVQVSQMQKWTLEKLNSFIPGTIYPVYAKNKKWGSKHYWSWSLNFLNSVCLMMTIYPLMSPKRQEQIRESLTYWKNTKQRRNKFSPVCQNGHSKAENTYNNPSGGKCCRACHKEREKERLIKYKNDPNYKTRCAEASKKWRKNHPEKAKEISIASNRKAREGRRLERENRICA
jgi:hypothetical protein